ncbi:ABC transporter substrate-binding protein [Lederbergia citrea]|uniref:Sugar ABC transporter substrate-binding protein n=1 Tax=Lederbergia citrea TaxID=2833581 RepID=A0A942Z5B3_9BACI|nr:sugar ABC transporter substrate-binding protein [Lederbergia citrea]MBS4178212.1 sugar ABC transporter substrate-binding protein [Lederbergia citrea]MBS4223260.1 sugar ABC transporter substrate-binding protein [Lederbergia citrea]
MKKKSILVLFFGLLAIVLAACGGKESSSEKATDTVVVGDDIKGATELSFWTFAGLHMEFFEDAAVRWNEANPDKPIKLKAETYPYDQMHNNLLLALQSGKGAPDIVDIEISRFPNYLQGEPQLLPMNEFVDPEIDNFVRARLDIYSKDGQFYGMPTHVGASVMYYNKEIMDEAGVDIDSIKTWEDYVEAGKQVVAKTGKMMTNVHTGDYMTMWEMISQQGSDWFDENGEVTVDSKENIKTLQFLHDMVYVNKIAELTPGGQPHAEEYYAYMNDGEAASISMPLWYMGRFIENMPDLKGKIVVRPMPAWEAGGFRSAGMGGTGTVVTNQTKHPEIAKEFLAFAKLSKEANIKLWTVLGFDPPRWDVWESDEVKADNKFYQFFGNDIFDTLLDIKDEINAVHITPQTPEVQNEINTVVFDSVLRQQSQTAEEALKEAADKIRSNKQ